MYKASLIQSLGTAVPCNKISQQEHYSILESANGLSREEKLHLRKIYNRSGIDYRYSVLEEFGRTDHSENILFNPSNQKPSLSVSNRMELYHKHASELCENAVMDCLKELPTLDVTNITHLITVSCTGMSAPGIDIQLVEKLGLNTNVERTCINFMGCYAGIIALKAGYHITRSQPNAIVLIVAIELCTLHYQKNNNQDQIIANALFADGAAACIISAQQLRADANCPGLSIEEFYSEFESSGKDEMVWGIGDFGFNLKLSAFVPELIRKNIFLLINKLFVKAGLTKEDISFYAIHPGGMKILEACEEALGISKDQNAISYNILKEYGNMSSVTIFFVLKEFLKSFKDEDHGKRLLACGFGPGLTMESMILKVN